VGSCVPNDELPPPLTSCVPAEPATPSFTLAPPPDEQVVTTDCVVMSVDPLVFECEEGFASPPTLSLKSSGAPLLAVGQAVLFEYWSSAAPDWTSSWLRIASSGSPVIIAAQADRLTPPEIDPSLFWPTDFRVEIADAVGCPRILPPCVDRPYEVPRRAASIVFNGAPFLSATTGAVPLAEPTRQFSATVDIARTGPSCEPFLAQQAGWYSFVLQRALHDDAYNGQACSEPGQPIVGSRDCAFLAARLRFSFQECQTCQGQPCDTVPGCNAPCVDGVHVYRGCCSDDDCAGVSAFCSSFASSPHGSCVVDDPE